MERGGCQGKEEEWEDDRMHGRKRMAARMATGDDERLDAVAGSQGGQTGTARRRARRRKKQGRGHSQSIEAEVEAWIEGRRVGWMEERRV